MISYAERAEAVQPRTSVGVTSSRAVVIWLFTVCVLIVGIVSFGGYVRLTRSGLSITEWNVIMGSLPPMTEEAWQAEFAKYQQTPEFQKVNSSMTLVGYKTIFYVEYLHRLVARIIGLIVVIPLGVFLWRGTIPWRLSGVYWLIAALFGLQGFMGWYMVSSGLVDRPAVSHYRLTIHLLLALLLLAITLWTALNLVRGNARGKTVGSRAAKMAAALLAMIVMQIAYGGLVAGLKAGHLSDTWPYMFGYLIPPGLFAVIEPWWLNLVETAATIHFVHRWFALVVLLMALALWGMTRKEPGGAATQRALALLVLLVIVQIALGVSVVWFHVPISLALIHQAVALLLFMVALGLVHQLRYPVQR